jgi:hypothetical protein
MVIKTMNPRVAGFLVSEASGSRSREEVTVNVPAETSIYSGQILGIVQLAAAAVAAAAGNTGNGTFTLDDPSVVGGAIAGVYVVDIIEAATDGGRFSVTDPRGVVIGTGEVGTAFSNQIAVTLADGATDFVVGDSFVVTVETSGLGYSTRDEDGTDGAAIARAVRVTALVNSTKSATTASAVIIARDAEVHDEQLTYTSTATDAEKAAADAQLAAVGILVRS